MISFIRIDDRMVHGQVITRWAKEKPCDGLIIVNDRVAKTPVLKNSFINSTDKKVFIWTIDEFIERQDRITESNRNYFLITKDPIDMKTLLVDKKFVPNDIKHIIVGPANDRPGTTKLGGNQSITQDEAQAIEDMVNAGYEVEFALVPETSIGTWSKFRSQFGF